MIDSPQPAGPDPLAPHEPAPEPRRRGPRWPLGALTLVAAAFVVIGIAFFGGDDQSGPTIPTIGGAPTGDEAPDFAVDLIAGGRFRLSDHLESDGRPVILNLWASWCGPCREEMPALDAVAAANPEVFLIGVAVDDDPTAARNFAAEIGVSYALAVDEDDAVGARYPSPGLPATFFVDGDGQLVRIVYGGVTQDQVQDLIDSLFG
ncbi:MAG: TlpA disulfide reductase family protein [Acidimicrobiia bacterium]